MSTFQRTMNKGLRGVVVSHGSLSAALVEAVRAITGDDHGLVAVSNDGCSRDSLMRLVADAAAGGESVLFVDLPGGSCLQAAVRFQREQGAIAVVAGVNLAMLLDFVHHRGLSAAEAAARAVSRGADAVRLVEV